jgi:hypothetical protein
MSRTTNRETAPRDRGPVDDRLARLLDTPFLERVVPHLAPETLHQLIQYRGLDACGELVTLATPTQLTSLLDLDLWRRNEQRRDEQFDVERFGEWLEVLVDTGESVAARTIAALDKQVVILGLGRYLRVFDPGTFEPVAQSDDEPIERHDLMNSETSRDVLECEVGGYLLRARRADAWDAIVTLLVTLEIEHNHDFHALMQGCRRLSNSTPEIDGLDDLLPAPEQHVHDAAIDREQRRSRHGYATSADARAFLQMARQKRAAAMATNPIVTAYFRAAEEEADTAPEDTSASVHESASHHDVADDIPSSIEAVVELLAEAGVIPERPRALLEAGNEDARARQVPLLKRLMEFLSHRDQTVYLMRTRELAFLANTLLAGSSVQSRPFTPGEASDAAACICNLGLESWPSRWASSSSLDLDTAVPPDAFLVDRDLVTAFEVGWSVLYQDVSLFVTDQLISTLADLHTFDADTRLGLVALRRTLEKQRESGTPWLARDAADALATLDTTAWTSVLGLLDECPILPEALRAVLERRTTPVSPTAFEFISTPAQIGDVRLFMKMLPEVLSR